MLAQVVVVCTSTRWKSIRKYIQSRLLGCPGDFTHIVVYMFAHNPGPKAAIFAQVIVFLVKVLHKSQGRARYFDSVFFPKQWQACL